jgi:outer membrane protein assembly factor BamE
MLTRIEAEGFAPKGDLPAAKPAVAAKAVEKPAEPVKAVVAAPAPAPSTPVAATVNTMPPPAETAKPVPPAEAAKPMPPAAVAVAEAAAKPAVPAAQPKPAMETAPAARQASPAPAASSADAGLNQTSIVPPLQSGQAAPAQAPSKAAQVRETPPEPVALQAEANVAAIKPDVMPEFPKAAAPATTEEQVVAALDVWAKAWRSRDEETYLAAYAATFRPEGGQTRAEWEKRRRLLLGLARNIDLQIDGVATEVVTEDRAQVSFRQFYRSETYQDAVIKQLKFVRVDNLWLIEEEKVLAPIKVKK